MLLQQADFRLITRLWGFLDKYRYRLILACLCSVGIAGLTSLYAWLVRPFLDGIFIERDQALLFLLPAAILGVTVSKGLLVYAQSYLMTHVSNWLVADLRDEVFHKIIRLPVSFHDSTSSGRLSARVLSDVAAMGNAIPILLKNLIQQAFTFLAMVGVLLYQDWKLTTVLLVGSVLSLYVASRFGKGLRFLTTRSQELSGDMAAFLKDAFSGIRILKVYEREGQEAARFRVSNHGFTCNSIKSGQLSAMTPPVMEMIGMTAITAIMAYGGSQVIAGAMTPGAFSSFVAAMMMLYSPIRRLGNAQSIVQSSLAAVERVFTVLDLEHEGVRDGGRPALPALSRSIEFRSLSFRYEDSHEDTLSGISLTIQAGEVVALVGKTGSGKTTLANLLPRFYEPSSGAILIDGQDIRAASLSSLRRQMAMVSQDTVLFDDTVRNNIAYSRIDATEEDVLDAARAAYALEFIDRLPCGLETVIGENGVKLSGGQRQRLAIARAILRNAPILILDEATSSLDYESERMVQQGLSNLMKGRTTLMIAHRLSTVQRADRIVVLHQGRIVGQGTHSLLFGQCEVYQRLCHEQLQ